MQTPPLHTILFLDIETVSQHAKLSEHSNRMQELWKKKSRRFLRGEDRNRDEDEIDWQDLYENRAAILAEFGKIVCISVGFLTMEEGGQLGMRIKSFADKDELTVLTAFAGLVDESFENRQLMAICGHNVREFDLPYIGRRMLIQGMPLPQPLQLQGKKPWEIKHVLDTLDFWKFGDYKHFTSLDLLSAVFEVPSPKEDMDGSQVGSAFWNDDDLDRIRIYCERDVWVTAAVFLRMNGKEFPSEEEVVYL
jgi:hypothetical protein